MLNLFWSEEKKEDTMQINMRDKKWIKIADNFGFNFFLVCHQSHQSEPFQLDSVHTNAQAI